MTCATHPTRDAAHDIATTTHRVSTRPCVSVSHIARRTCSSPSRKRTAVENWSNMLHFCTHFLRPPPKKGVLSPNLPSFFFINPPPPDISPFPLRAPFPI